MTEMITGSRLAMILRTRPSFRRHYLQEQIDVDVLVLGHRPGGPEHTDPEYRMPQKGIAPHQAGGEDVSEEDLNQAESRDKGHQNNHDPGFEACEPLNQAIQAGLKGQVTGFSRSAHGASLAKRKTLSATISGPEATLSPRPYFSSLRFCRRYLTDFIAFDQNVQDVASNASKARLRIHYRCGLWASRLAGLSSKTGASSQDLRP